MLDNKKQICVELLASKYAELLANGENRYPKRADFSDAQVCSIKASLGPWPRALEAAGIKPPRDDNAKEKAKEKRIRSRRRARMALDSCQTVLEAQINKGEK